MRYRLLALLMILTGSICYPQSVSHSLTQSMKLFDPPLSPRIANYQISAVLAPAAKTVTGHEHLSWRNTSTTPVKTVQLHLYLNAFKNNQSTFIIEEGRNSSTPKAKEDWGYCSITSIKSANGIDLKPRMNFIHPDDDNAADETVAEVTLPSPVPPGGTFTADIEFISKLPRVMARSGFADNDFFMVAQWFPKIGVFENGAWNCHQYHAHSEFFADFGTYDVDITTPERFVVAANGILVGKHRASGNVTYRYHQEDVHDFVWAADPRFVTWHDSFHNDSTGRDVDIRLYSYRLNSNYAPLHIDYVKHALQYFQEWYGVYPYSNITIVDPPSDALAAGGMEYPTFFTTMTVWWLPSEIHLAAIVTMHEFGHNFFQGMLATNEFEESWMDEGMNQYSEMRCLERYYGTSGSYIDYLGYRLDGVTYNRMGYISRPYYDPIDTKSWMFGPGEYSMDSYNRPALVLRTLENLVGTETMNRIMKTYFNEWKFKHPTTQDFIRTANRAAGRDLSWYFNQTLFTNATIDFRVQSFTSEKQPRPLGLFGTDTSIHYSGSGTLDSLYQNTAIIGKVGSLNLPVDVQFMFEDGTQRRDSWDGTSPSKQFSFFSPSKLIRVIVDPDYKIALDVNRLNNSVTSNPSAESAVGFTRILFEVLSRFQSFLQHLTFFI